MTPRLCPALLERLEARFARLYGEARAAACLRRLVMLVGRYGIGFRGGAADRPLAPGDQALIAYADMIRPADGPPLAALHRFLPRVRGAFSMVHLLPFFPASSDDGFSVIDYRAVDPALGGWAEIEAIGRDIDLVFDLVLNHTSRHSGWFRDFVDGIAPARDYFLPTDPQLDLSAVVRPRTHPLLTEVHTRGGERHVWTTFSADQVDLDFANPDVLFEFLDILLRYIARGARVVRLDAIAFLWKRPGTSCLHLPETHEVVRLLRDFVGLVAPHVRLLTETNVPHEENVSYFGSGDEAHLVYQFSLPPLLLHALLRGSARRLTDWAARLSPPPAGCAFFNFTASHDGIGVRPLEGLIPASETAALAAHVEAIGGRVSMKRNADGSTSPYELNTTWFDAVGEGSGPATEAQIARHLLSQTLPLALQGVPGVYFHSLVAARNDRAGADASGIARRINRARWSEPQLAAALDDESTVSARVFGELVRRLRARAAEPAFDPAGGQQVLDLHEAVFAVVRTAPDSRRAVAALHNLSDRPVEVELPTDLGRRPPAGWPDLLNGHRLDVQDGRRIQIDPYAARWLRLRA